MATGLDRGLEHHPATVRPGKDGATFWDYPFTARRMMVRWPVKLIVMVLLLPISIPSWLADRRFAAATERAYRAGAAGFTFRQHRYIFWSPREAGEACEKRRGAQHRVPRLRLRRLRHPG